MLETVLLNFGFLLTTGGKNGTQLITLSQFHIDATYILLTLTFQYLKTDNIQPSQGRDNLAKLQELTSFFLKNNKPERDCKLDV